jgi:hypothetical protein
MNPRPYKILSERQGISMINSKIRQDLMRTRRRKVIQDSRRRSLNPQYLRTMGKSLR